MPGRASSLPTTLPGRSSAELFWIVRHGIKYTGMPAWPAANRDDEVWPVVAFLEALPKLDGLAYRQLAGLAPAWAAPAAAPVAASAMATALAPSSKLDSLITDCARCHGQDGAGRGLAGVPFIGGQSERYVQAALDAYAAGTRPSGIMQPLVAVLSDGQRAQLAAHYASQRWPAAKLVQPAEAARGADIATSGLPAQAVPPCAGCHGAVDRYQTYPRLHAQDATYLANQLRLFQAGQRGGSLFAPLMSVAAHHLHTDDIAARVAH